MKIINGSSIIPHLGNIFKLLKSCSKINKWEIYDKSKISLRHLIENLGDINLTYKINQQADAM